MIDDVDQTLRVVFERAFEKGDVKVAFDAPTDGWAAGLEGPVLNLFLHDVNEDADAVAGDMEDVRDSRGLVVGRQPPTRRYRLSYLVSAWATTAEQEHGMLSSLLELVAEREAVPSEHLCGRLSWQELPVTMRVARTDESRSRVTALWSALGTRMRSSVELLVTASLVPAVVTDVAPPADQIHLDMVKEPGSPTGAAPVRPRQHGAPAMAGRVVRRWTRTGIAERAGDGADGAHGADGAD